MFYEHESIIVILFLAEEFSEIIVSVKPENLTPESSPIVVPVLNTSNEP